MEEQLNSNCWYLGRCSIANSVVPTQECTERCLVYVQLKWQMDNCGLPKNKQYPMKLRITDANRVDTKAFYELSNLRKDIVRFVEDGKNLCLASNYTGNGKTSWAIRLLQTYLHHRASGNYENLQAMFVSVPDLLLKLKDFNNPLSASYKQQLTDVNLVVWDEIALTGVSQYDYNQLYVFIESRILAGKSNIFTCNCATDKELENILGARLTSRIWNSSRVLTFYGPDERG